MTRLIPRHLGGNCFLSKIKSGFQIQAGFSLVHCSGHVLLCDLGENISELVLHVFW